VKPQSVTLLSPFFFPELISTGKYNGNVAAALAKSGVEVNVICSHPLYPTWKPQIAANELHGVTAFRGGGSLSYPSHPLGRRALLELWFAWHCLRYITRLPNNTSHVVPVFPPSLFMLAVPLLKPKRAATVGIVHDLQGVYAARLGGGLFKTLLNKAITAVERHAFKACDHLIFLSESMRDVTLEAYDIDLTRTSVHYPFVTLDDSAPKLTQRLAHTFDPEYKYIVYSGALGEKQAPTKLACMLLNILENHPNWQARIYSEGPLFEQLQQQYKHSRLSFHPLVAKEDLPELLQRSDIQVIPQDIATSDGSLPSKLPNVMAAGTPLLCITDPGSELEGLVNRYPSGAVSTSWNAKHTLSAFQQIQHAPRVKKADISDLLAQFTLEGLVQRLLSIQTK
jgi:colanic acid biosynthesis glycosyl transferase WcaI